jgi:hypothetical protein
VEISTARGGLLRRFIAKKRRLGGFMSFRVRKLMVKTIAKAFFEKREGNFQ